MIIQSLKTVSSLSLSGSELPLREIKMTWLLAFAVCLSAQDLHYLPSPQFFFVLFLFFSCLSGSLQQLETSTWSWAGMGQGEIPITSYGPPPGVMPGILELSSTPPVAPQPLSHQAAGGRRRCRTGVPVVILGAHTRPRLRLPPVSVSLCCLVTKSSLTFCNPYPPALLSRGLPKQEF